MQHYQSSRLIVTVDDKSITFYKYSKKWSTQCITPLTFTELTHLHEKFAGTKQIIELVIHMFSTLKVHNDTHARADAHIFTRDTHIRT